MPYMKTVNRVNPKHSHHKKIILFSISLTLPRCPLNSCDNHFIMHIKQVITLCTLNLHSVNYMSIKLEEKNKGTMSL